MTHDEIRTRIKPILVDHVKAAHGAVDVAINAVRLDDRERIAELERDLNRFKVGFNLSEADLVKACTERDEARANLAQNAAITETLRAELAALRAIDEQLPPSGTYRCDGCGSLWDEKHALVKESPTYGACHCIDSPRYVYSLPSYVSLRPFVEGAVTPVVEEEQGPWVFYEADAECLMWGGIGDHEEGEVIEWSSFFDDVTPWSRKADVEALHAKACEDSGVRKGSPKMRVITLAEARRIAGAK